MTTDDDYNNRNKENPEEQEQLLRAVGVKLHFF